MSLLSRAQSTSLSLSLPLLPSSDRPLALSECALLLQDAPALVALLSRGLAASVPTCMRGGRWRSCVWRKGRPAAASMSEWPCATAAMREARNSRLKAAVLQRESHLMVKVK